ncbi:unnamed protein product [Plutella xylostella]|uniref:(diamondback moth) hypothetical protein n=1 Tax=Plutella xylostella TaxID=51655 RepID=A0A8S4GB34_PLUXY|nr:unnamed protein product [Plutella xylostella]
MEIVSRGEQFSWTSSGKHLTLIWGIWNVPFITNVYLVKSSVLRKYSGKVTYSRPEVDPDMAFCQSLREAGIFMHVSNEFQFGHLVNPESYDVTKTHPDVYQVIDNKEEWEARYLHPDYAMNFEDNRTHLQPCPDVYWFPLMSQRFCVEWIAIMEAYGKWSAGDNKDDRLPGGYEAVPTRDIHMSQVGLERQWLHILKEYVRPLQEMVFIGYYHNVSRVVHSFMGYYHNPPVSVMNFVVRYRPDEQPSLRPHHDASTYTINLALNTPLSGRDPFSVPASSRQPCVDNGTRRRPRTYARIPSTPRTASNRLLPVAS